MATEIEAKMAVKSHEPVRQRLTELAAAHVSDVQETNTFFDTPGSDLQKQDRGLRVRVNRNTATQTETYVVTVKGPRQSGRLKNREEAEVGVDEAIRAYKVFELLGFQKQVSFEKRRQTWRLNGCSVELDELPYLGRFVEIEGPDEETVLKVRDCLGLGDLPMIKTGYIAMLMNHLSECGIKDRDVRLE